MELVAAARSSPSSKAQVGLFTKSQFQVLKLRSKGLNQNETARELRTTRANVSMIEHRARRKIEMARETIRAYESTLSEHLVKVGTKTRLQEVPRIVLDEGDRYGIHIRTNIVDIIRVVKSIEPKCIKGGRTSRELVFKFNQSGKLSVY